jgi:glycine cleavage system H protein
VKVNESLEDSPELINTDPYGAFIFVLELADPSAVDSLMSAAEYSSFVESEKEE